MVLEIHLDRLYEDPGKLGLPPASEDYDRIINEDCDVYHNGELLAVFRKRAIKSLVELTPDSDGYKYWKWASRSLVSDQRGAAAGRVLDTIIESRLTAGQQAFFKAACKNGISQEDALELLQDKTPVTQMYRIQRVEEDNLVNLEEIEHWNSLLRKKDTSPEDRKEAQVNRDKAKLAWFENWFENVWLPAEDQIAVAKAAKKRYISAQVRGNKRYSNVLGTIDRSGRKPYGRLTKSTLERYEDFESFKGFYQEVDQLVKKYMPGQWQMLHEQFQHVKDERYNLFGTGFTSITINHNFDVARHYDGRNCPGAVAALTALDSGQFEDFDFVIHDLRLAFRLRQGDIIIADNQGMEHSITKMRNASPDAESITFVFYSKTSIISLDSLDCETCRFDFMKYMAENHPEYGTGEPGWNGSATGLWGSKLWDEYKLMRSKEGDFDYTTCSNTNINCNEDKMELVVRQPHLARV